MFGVNLLKKALNEIPASPIQGVILYGFFFVSLTMSGKKQQIFFYLFDVVLTTPATIYVYRHTHIFYL